MSPRTGSTTTPTSSPSLSTRRSVRGRRRVSTVTTVGTIPTLSLSLTTINTHTQTEGQAQHITAGDKHLDGGSDITSNINHGLGQGMNIDMLTMETTLSTLSTLTTSNIQTSAQCQTQHASAGDGQLGDGDDGHDGQQHLHNVRDDRQAGQTLKSTKRADFKLVKKRDIVPDGLVQTRLNSFLKAFPNLRGGGGAIEPGRQGEGGSQEKVDLNDLGPN